MGHPSKIVFSIPITVAVLLILASPSHAWHGRRHHDSHSHFGHVSLLPYHHQSVWSGGVRYYYSDGYYYYPSGSDYVIVPPPAAAVVQAIPVGYQAVVIDGVTYYTNEGSYYVRTPAGFQVVPTPVVAAPAASGTRDVPAQAAEAAGETAPVAESLRGSNDGAVEFTVNIPNDTGGYTPVVIKRTQEGFIGPQGEYYQEFPKVSQLMVMYGTTPKKPAAPEASE